MRFATYRTGRQVGLAVGSASSGLHGLLDGEPGFPGPLSWLIAQGSAALRSAGEQLAKAPVIDPAAIEWLPPLPAPGKIICVCRQQLLP